MSNEIECTRINGTRVCISCTSFNDPQLMDLDLKSILRPALPPPDGPGGIQILWNQIKKKAYSF